MGATPGMRAMAGRLAEIARFALARRKAGMLRAEAVAAGRWDRSGQFTPARPDGCSRAGAPKVRVPTEAWAVERAVPDGRMVAVWSHRKTGRQGGPRYLAWSIRRPARCWI